MLLWQNRVYAQKDTLHYSQVFKNIKEYRIFLPAVYSSNPTKRYPVIYYFHGNQGTHQFKFDIQQLIDLSEVIMVAWNGRSVPDDQRPYNIGYHANVNFEIQFKDYFPELVCHIDSTYRTLNDRNHRALLGHSMGGFMSFLLAGKFPHLVCAAVSSKGSPEFFVGSPKNHTLYHTRYMFGNLHGINFRFHNGGPGEELHYLNKEVHEGGKRELGLRYTFKEYPGTHAFKPDEFKEAFDFIIESFKAPLPPPLRWHHADFYPDFNVWGYDVKTDLRQPGYIDMKGVTHGGLGIRTRKWMPDGPIIPGVTISIATAPVYKPNAKYTVIDYNVTDQTKKTIEAETNADGRLHFTTDGKYHQFGINQKSESPEIVFIKHKVDDSTIFLNHHKQSRLKLSLLNRGGSPARNLTITLSTSAKGVTISNPVIKTSDIQSGDLAWLPVDFKVKAAVAPVPDGSPFKIRFNVSIKDDKGNTWQDETDIPVWYKVPLFNDIGIDDGDSEIFGSGNGNNIAEPGETIMIYQHSNRTRLYYDDPYIDGERLHDDLQPDKWGDGYALSSLIHISRDCPPGHKIRFLACYEVKEWKTIKRNVTWGTFTITVGKSQ